jgi:hypothetical protein
VFSPGSFLSYLSSLHPELCSLLAASSPISLRCILSFVLYWQLPIIFLFAASWALFSYPQLIIISAVAYLSSHFKPLIRALFSYLPAEAHTRTAYSKFTANHVIKFNRQDKRLPY